MFRYLLFPLFACAFGQQKPTWNFTPLGQTGRQPPPGKAKGQIPGSKHGIGRRTLLEDITPIYHYGKGTRFIPVIATVLYLYPSKGTSKQPSPYDYIGKGTTETGMIYNQDPYVRYLVTGPATQIGNRTPQGVLNGGGASNYAQGFMGRNHGDAVSARYGGNTVTPVGYVGNYMGGVNQPVVPYHGKERNGQSKVTPLGYVGNPKAGVNPAKYIPFTPSMIDIWLATKNIGAGASGQTRVNKKCKLPGVGWYFGCEPWHTTLPAAWKVFIRPYNGQFHYKDWRGHVDPGTIDVLTNYFNLQMMTAT